MTKGRVSEVVAESDRFGQIFVKTKSARDRSANGRDLDRMSKASSQMVARSVEKNLCLVLQPAKGAGMNYPGPISLELGPIGMARFWIFSPARIAGLLREWRQGCSLRSFHLLTRSDAASLL